MGFRKVVIYEAAAVPSHLEVLRITLRDGRLLHASVGDGDNPLGIGFIVKPEHMQPWLREMYAEGLARVKRDSPELAPYMPQDYSQATGKWAVRLSDCLSPDRRLVVRLGQTDIALVIEPNDIMHMMPTAATSVQPAHS